MFCDRKDKKKKKSVLGQQLYARVPENSIVNSLPYVIFSVHFCFFLFLPCNPESIVRIIYIRAPGYFIPQCLNYSALYTPKNPSRDLHTRVYA